VKLEEYYASH
jgi:DNA replication protein DnaC